MEQALYQLIARVAAEYGLQSLLLANATYVLRALLILALFMCPFGFYCYRAVVSGVTFLAVALLGAVWVRPHTWELAAVTFSAVIGVVMAFLAFRFYRPGAMALCAAIAASFVLPLIWQGGALSLGTVIILILLCLAVAVLTAMFPLWSVCAFTSSWGAVSFVAYSAELWPNAFNGLGAAMLGIVLGVGGCALQLVLFRKQKLFARIMPQRVEYALERRKIERASK